MPMLRAKAKYLEMIARGEKPLGVFVSSMDPASTEVLASAGFDFVLLDGEHGKFSRIEVEHHVRAAELKGATPFVRILENSPALIQSMLDAGAHGIVIPHVDDAEQARLAVTASRYAPQGRRGMCPACYAGSYTLDNWIEYTRTANDNVMIIPIIESVRAVENIEAIAAVDGIDVIHFGPGDLSADMGLDLTKEADKLMDAYARVRQAARSAGKHVLSPAGFGFDDSEMLIEQMDLMLLFNAAAAKVAQHREAAAAPTR